MDKFVECKQCGHSYSVKIRRCPECGNRTPFGMNQIITVICFAAVVVISLVGIVLGLKDGEEKIAVSSEVNTESTETLNSEQSIAKDNILNNTSENSESKSTDEPEKNLTGRSDVFDDSANVSTVQEEITMINITKEITDLMSELNEDITSITETDKQYGILSNVKNADGSLSISFKKSGYEKYKTDLLAKTQKRMNEAVADSGLACIKAVKSDYGILITHIYVDTSIYNSDNDKEKLKAVMDKVGTMALLCHRLMGIPKGSISVAAEDSNNGKQIISATYPNSY